MEHAFMLGTAVGVGDTAPNKTGGLSLFRTTVHYGNVKFTSSLAQAVFQVLGSHKWLSCWVVQVSKTLSITRSVVLKTHGPQSGIT